MRKGLLSIFLILLSLSQTLAVESVLTLDKNKTPPKHCQQSIRSPSSVCSAVYDSWKNLCLVDLHPFCNQDFVCFICDSEPKENSKKKDKKKIDGVVDIPLEIINVNGETISESVKINGAQIDSSDARKTIFNKVITAFYGVKKLDTQKEVNDFFDRNNTVAIFGFDSSDIEGWDLFVNVLTSCSSFKYAFTHEKGLVDSSRANNQRVLTIKRKWDSQKVSHSEDFTLGDIEQFLLVNSNDMIYSYNEMDSPSKILGPELPTLFLLNPQANEKIRKTYENAAKLLKNEIKFVEGDPDNPVTERLLNYMRLTDSNEQGTGLWILILHYSTIYKYKFPFEEVNFLNILKFIQLYDQNKISRYYHTSPAPDPESNKGPLLEAVGSTFRDLVIDNDYNVFVDFYGSFCGHCKIFAPTLEEIAQEMSSDNLRFVKIEMSNNEIGEVDIHSYPTLILFKAGQKDRPIWYPENQSRDKDLVKAFIENNIKISDQEMPDI